MNVKDGKKAKRFTLAGGFMILSGVLCLIIKAFSREYVDQAGILHEKFFLLLIGFLLPLIGLVLLALGGIRYQEIYSNNKTTISWMRWQFYYVISFNG